MTPPTPEIVTISSIVPFELGTFVIITNERGLGEGILGVRVYLLK